METMRKRVFIVQDREFLNAKTTEIVQLPHPSNGEPAEYMICNQNTIFEIQAAHVEPSSWFIGQHVESSGVLYLASRIDPLFIVLSILESKAASVTKNDERGRQFVPLDQLIVSADFPCAAKLLPCVESSISRICDVNDALLDEGIMLVRFDKAKSDQWVQAKLNQTESAVAASGNLVKQQVAAVESFNFVSTTNGSSNSKRTSVSSDLGEVSRIALQILSEYVTKTRLEELASELRLTLDQVFAKNKTGVAPDKTEVEKRSWEEANGYAKSAESEYLKYKMSSEQARNQNNHEQQQGKTSVSQTKAKKSRTVSLGVMKLAKVDTRNMKSISSFFGKPKVSQKSEPTKNTTQNEESKKIENEVVQAK